MIRFRVEKNVYHCSQTPNIFRTGIGFDGFNSSITTAFGKNTKYCIDFSSRIGTGVLLYTVVHKFYLDGVMYDEVNRWKLIRIK